ncbi:hypothetical protein ES702_05578 [subsurface metagenome]
MFLWLDGKMIKNDLIVYWVRWVYWVYRVCRVYRVWWVGCVSYLLLCSGALARPVVVVGDTSALAALGYTSYFEDQSVFFFTSQLSSSQIKNLLEKTKSMVIVNNDLKRYGKEVQNFLNNPAVDLAYLFFREKSEDSLKERSFYLPTESRYRMKARVILDLSQVKKNIGLDLDVGLAQELQKLSFISRNVEYTYFISDEGTLSVNAYFDREPSKETGDEYVKVTIPHLSLDIDKYPFLELIYRVQDSEVQQIDGELGIDLTANGRVDKTISLRKEIILGNWMRGYPATPTTDLYDTRLPQNWPKTYSTERPSQDKFTVYKNGVPLETTWCKWYNYQNQVEIGVWHHNRLVITIPKGESPEDSTYVVSYLPPAVASVKKSKKFPEFSRLEVNIKEAIEETFRGKKKPKLVNISLYLKRARGVNFSSPGKKRAYSFDIKKITAYGRPSIEELLRGDNKWLKEKSLFRIAGKIYRLEDMDTVKPDSDTFWCEIENLKLRKGNYEFLPMPSETLKVHLAVIEPLPRPRSGESQEKELQIEFQKINSARYRVQVKARKSFWLIFRESFHPGWKAYMRHSSRVKSQGINFEWSAVLSGLQNWGKKIGIKEHYSVNGYANAWWVPVGESEGKTKEQESSLSEFEIIIEYTPQRWFEIRMVVSLIVLVGGVGYLVFRFRQRRTTG